MSEEFDIDSESQVEASQADTSEEYEEISSEEVDRIVEALENLSESTTSENIKTYLEEALNGVYYLVYDEEDEEDESSEELSDEVSEAA